MEYTKDIILDIRYKREIGIIKLKSWISKLKKGIKNNKLIITTLVLLSSLILIDIILVNSFLQLFMKIY